MMTILDASVILRYLVNDHPAHARAAADVIDSGESLLVGLVVLSEVAYVMTRGYGIPRDEVVNGLVEFLGRANLDVIAIDKSLVRRSLLLCRGSGRISFADALIHAEARHHNLPVYTFERRFPSEDIVVRHPEEGKSE